MPVYEYICDACEHHFEMKQSMTTTADETACPQCNKMKSRRLMSSFASKIVGTHKTGHAEMKAYDMLGERMNKFKKLPPIMGQRAAPTVNNSQPPGAGGSDS